MLRSSVLLFLLIVCLTVPCEMRPSYGPPMGPQPPSMMMEPRPMVGPVVRGPFPRRDPLRGMLAGALIGGLIGAIADSSAMMGRY